MEHEPDGIEATRIPGKERTRPSRASWPAAKINREARGEQSLSDEYRDRRVEPRPRKMILLG